MDEGRAFDRFVGQTPRGWLAMPCYLTINPCG